MASLTLAFQGLQGSSETHRTCTHQGMALDNDSTTQTTARIIGAAITIHRSLGPGLLESAYQACLEYELTRTRVNFKRQVAVPLNYEGVYIDCGYRLDLIVENQVVVEVKSIEAFAKIHYAQVITYLRLTQCPVGLLLNFNVPSMREGIRRIRNRSLQNDAVQRK